MNTFSLMLAWRYILGSGHQKNIGSMVKICFISICIGSFSLALVTAIMNGFEKATHEKIQGIQAQITMRSSHDCLDEQAVSEVLEKEFPSIEAFSPTSVRQVIIQKQLSDDITNVALLKAINPEKESKVTTLNNTIIESTSNKSLVSTISDSTIIIGKTLAENISVKIGDTVNLLYSQDEKARSYRITLAQKTAVVAGIFTTGIEEFDAAMALCSFSFFDTIFPDYGVSQFNIKLKEHTPESATIEKLRARFHLDVVSWKDMYPALVAALKLEKYAMFIILALITLVASMNIISLLFMQITQKRGDIAILYSLGITNRTIATTFLCMGMMIIISATLVGILLATGACWILQTYPFITLPDAYYVSHLPAAMDWPITLTVFIVTISIGVLASWIPAKRSKNIHVSDVLRFEA
jgi:lipoprotein-releasing system permease protein